MSDSLKCTIKGYFYIACLFFVPLKKDQQPFQVPGSHLPLNEWMNEPQWQNISISHEILPLLLIWQDLIWLQNLMHSHLWFLCFGKPIWKLRKCKDMQTAQSDLGQWDGQHIHLINKHANRQTNKCNWKVFDYLTRLQ